MAKGFGDAFDDFTAAFIDGSEETMRAVTTAIADGAIKQSPVDNGSEFTKNIGGNFRANWFVTGKQPSTKYTEKTDKAGITTTNEAKIKALTIKDWSVFNITNNSPQARVIEFGGYPNPVANGTRINAAGTRQNPVKPIYEQRSSGGYSKQAPSGVLRINVARVKANFDKIAKEHLPK